MARPSHGSLATEANCPMIELLFWHAIEFVLGVLTPTPKVGNLGQRGESLATRYLRRRGYLILERQCRDRFAEADIIAFRSRQLVFVEVKTRQFRCGKREKEIRPEEAVDRVKQSRLVGFANRYCDRNGLSVANTRFDVIAILWRSSPARPTTRHFRDAF